MGKLVFLCAVFTCCAGYAGASLENFEQYVETFGKAYKSPIEASMRREIFSRNRQFVAKFNSEEAELVGFELALNHLADATSEEWSLKRGKGSSESQVELPRNSLKAEQFFANLMANVSSADIPDEVDWTKVKGRVTRVKDNGFCSAAHAFAATGALEGQMMTKKNGSLIPLSEQFIIDCSYSNQGCSDGRVEWAWVDINSFGGINGEESYQFTGNDNGKCRFRESSPVFTDAGFYALKSGDEEQLKQVVAVFGPVAIKIDSSPLTFSYYSNGVWSDVRCGNTLDSLNHDLLVVGYGKDARTGLDYWLVKNHWGKAWGIRGYIKMLRNKDNHCGVATKAMIPIV